MAARKGHEDILAYLRRNDCPWDDRCGYTKCRAWAMAHGVRDAKGYSGDYGDFDKYASDSESSGPDNYSDRDCYFDEEDYRCGCRGCRRGFSCGNWDY
jgi:hypothetical protein